MRVPQLNNGNGKWLFFGNGNGKLDVFLAVTDNGKLG